MFIELALLSLLCWDGWPTVTGSYRLSLSCISQERYTSHCGQNKRLTKLVTSKFAAPYLRLFALASNTHQSFRPLQSHLIHWEVFCKVALLQLLPKYPHKNRSELIASPVASMSPSSSTRISIPKAHNGSSVCQIALRRQSRQWICRPKDSATEDWFG